MNNQQAIFIKYISIILALSINIANGFLDNENSDLDCVGETRKEVTRTSNEWKRIPSGFRGESISCLSLLPNGDVVAGSSAGNLMCQAATGELRWNFPLTFFYISQIAQYSRKTHKSDLCRNAYDKEVANLQRLEDGSLVTASKEGWIGVWENDFEYNPNWRQPSFCRSYPLKLRNYIEDNFGHIISCIGSNYLLWMSRDSGKVYGCSLDEGKRGRLSSKTIFRCCKGLSHFSHLQGNEIAIGTRDQAIHLLDVQTKKTKRRFPSGFSRREEVTCFKLLPGSLLAIGSALGSIRLVDTCSGNCTHSFPQNCDDYRKGIWGFDMPKEGILLSCPYKGKVHIWNVKESTYIRAVGHESDQPPYKLLSDGRLFVRDGRIYNLNSGEQEIDFKSMYNGLGNSMYRCFLERNNGEVVIGGDSGLDTYKKVDK